ncbi:GNAT family N-acetyltransferase [Lewinella sp. LCG006]|uniref:GNAT family N-acetyltransferase n=1 Tax=Lewinella sp. LCG006 TaxID=3231911 RepID=UPI0034615E4B
MNVYLETPRLILRAVKEEDAPGFFELDSDPEVHKFLGNKPVKDIKESEEAIKYIQKQYEEKGIGRLAIIDKASKEFVGWSGLKYETVVRADFPYYDLGYRLKKKFWGKGIATEAAIASLEYGFLQLRLEEIYAAADLDNMGSNKVLQKLGMKLVDQFEYCQALHNWYKITTAEWLAMSS